MIGLIKRIKKWFLLKIDIIKAFYEIRVLDKIIIRRNHRRWKKVIDIDYDYHFVYLIIIIRHKLNLIEEVWGKNTNHEKDYEEKEKLQELIKDADWLIDKILLEDHNSEEYKKRSKSFFNKLDRIHTKLID